VNEYEFEVSKSDDCHESLLIQKNFWYNDEIAWNKRLKFIFRIKRENKTMIEFDSKMPQWRDIILIVAEVVFKYHQ